MMCLGLIRGSGLFAFSHIFKRCAFSVLELFGGRGYGVYVCVSPLSLINVLVLLVYQSLEISLLLIYF